MSLFSLLSHPHGEGGGSGSWTSFLLGANLLVRLNANQMRLHFRSRRFFRFDDSLDHFIHQIINTVVVVVIVVIVQVAGVDFDVADVTVVPIVVVVVDIVVVIVVFVSVD